MVNIRNNELTNLRRRDVIFGCDGPPPYHQDHIKVTLSQRLAAPRGSGQGRRLQISLS